MLIDNIIINVLQCFKWILRGFYTLIQGRLYPRQKNANLPRLRLYILRNNCAHLCPVASCKNTTVAVYPKIAIEHYSNKLWKMLRNLHENRLRFKTFLRILKQGWRGSFLFTRKFGTGVSKILRYILGGNYGNKWS